MKYTLAAAAAAIVAMFAAVPSASAFNSAICVGANEPGIARCAVRTTDKHVSVAIVRSGKFTSGAWRLRCVQGSATSLQTGEIGRNDRLVIEPDLPNPNCRLSARVHSPRRVGVRIALN